MGFRTVVALSNDQAYEWGKDPELGKKIMMAGHYAYRNQDKLPYNLQFPMVM